MEEKEAKLIDLLRSVPADARLIYERDEFHSQAIPVGALCAKAAAALNQQAGAVEALRPLEVELEKLDDATERDSTPEMVGATWRLIEAARAALAAVKGVES